MKLTKYIIPLIIAAFLSCAQNNSESKVISRDIFKEIITDIHFKDGIISSYNSNAEPRILVPEEFYDSIFIFHGTNRDRFLFSYAYYTSTRELEEIYSEVITNLNKEKASLKQEQKKENTPTSSIDTTSKND